MLEVCGALEGVYNHDFGGEDQWEKQLTEQGMLFEGRKETVESELDSGMVGVGRVSQHEHK